MKPEPRDCYDLHDCCKYIQEQLPILKDVDFWGWFTKQVQNGGQDTCYTLNCMDEISYIEYEDYGENALDYGFKNEEDFKLMRAFYLIMVNEFGDSSYMRIWW